MFAFASQSFRLPTTIAAAALMALTLAWAYWPTLAALNNRWAADPQYSHGYLVPLFALGLLFVRRQRLAGVVWQLHGVGLPLLLAAGILRVAGANLHYEFLDQASLPLALLGTAVWLGGGLAGRWAWPAAAFLLFMVPLPHRVETLLGYPLQRLATLASTFALQTLGWPAFAEGNVIRLDEHRLFVAEACSGLSMLMIFLALSTAVAITIRRPWLDRGIILVSAIPVALVVNVIRITATAMAYQLAGPQLGELIFHDLAGWLMMPLALGFLWLELRFLAVLLVPPSKQRPKPSLRAETPGVVRHRAPGLRPRVWA